MRKGKLPYVKTVVAKGRRYDYFDTGVRDDRDRPDPQATACAGRCELWECLRVTVGGTGRGVPTSSRN